MLLLANKNEVNSMSAEANRDLIKAGEQDYNEWKASLTDTPEKAARYQEIAGRSDLWLQRVEARQAAGLTQRQVAKRLGVSQAQVARTEKQGYESYTLTTLHRYLKALGEGFSLEISVRKLPDVGPPTAEQTVAG